MNIIPPDFAGEVKYSLLKETQEKTLHEVYNSIKGKVISYRDRHDYENAFSAIAELKPHVDLFFDKVLVMDKDANLMNNRLSLLKELKELFLTLADFTQIVVGG
jgi:glycyl-tRNA synthetase beta chain